VVQQHAQVGQHVHIADHVPDADHLDPQPGLLLDLADHRVRGMLGVLDTAAGQEPPAGVARQRRGADQEYPARAVATDSVRRYPPAPQ
jgi:hypothetical protein